MTTKIHLLLVMALSHVLLFALVTVSSTPVEGDNGILEDSIQDNQLEYIGMSDGSFYFVDRKIYLNWTAASAHCQSFNLELGTVKTDNQWTFLTEALGQFSPWWYWTSARESHEPAMFVWNGTDTHLDTAVVKDWYKGFYENATDYRYCASFFSFQQPHRPAMMQAELCTAKNRVLCQANE